MLIEEDCGASNEVLFDNHQFFSVNRNVLPSPGSDIPSDSNCCYKRNNYEIAKEQQSKIYSPPRQVKTIQTGKVPCALIT